MWLVEEGSEVVQGEETDIFDVALLVAMAQGQRAAGITADTYTVFLPRLPSPPTQTYRRWVVHVGSVPHCQSRFGVACLVPSPCSYTCLFHFTK
jgi:hypothetical protein